jgi:hypothetical protein
MKLGRFAVGALALSAVMMAGTRAEAANGSNYIHLMNGLDYFYAKTPPAGNLTGIWRCFPSEMLHSPTLVIDPASAEVGNYATKIVTMHMVVTASVGKLITFPTVALTSAPGTCDFTVSGALNYALFSVAGFGTIIGGPTSPGGPAAVNLLAIVGNVQLPNPAASFATIVEIALNLSALFGSPSTVAVPEGETLVFWVQDDPNQFGAGTMQYWTGSQDEQYLCSISHSFLFSGSSSLAFSLIPAAEWAIGLGTLDATATPAITSNGPGPSGLNAHDALQGFNPGFDQGTGTLTISNTGFLGAGETLGFAVYDENNQYGGAWRLAFGNLPGVFGTCAGYTPTPWPSGFGGPVLSGAFPTLPRSVLVLDPLSSLLLGNPIWLLSTNHSTNVGGLNRPWVPGPADVSGGNMTGNHAGFGIPLPISPAIPGLLINWANFAVDPTDSFLDHGGALGHSLSNSYQTLFFP